MDFGVPPPWYGGDSFNSSDTESPSSLHVQLRKGTRGDTEYTVQPQFQPSYLPRLKRRGMEMAFSTSATSRTSAPTRHADLACGRELPAPSYRRVKRFMAIKSTGLFGM